MIIICNNTFYFMLIQRIIPVFRIIVLLFIAFSVLVNCSEKKPMEQSSINLYALNAKSAKTVKLSKKLQELSGLAMSADDRLFGHNDERAVIYQRQMS